MTDRVDIHRLAHTELILLLERAQLDNATAFVCIALDAESGDVLTCTGPFDQAEQAFAQGCRDEATWRAQKTPEDAAITHTVIPLWAGAK